MEHQTCLPGHLLFIAEAVEHRHNGDVNMHGRRDVLFGIHSPSRRAWPLNHA